MGHEGRLPQSCPEVTTLLFDLDGTLVHMKWRGLQLRLMARAVVHFSEGIRPWSFSRAFWRAIKEQQAHGTDRTNYDVFLDVLGRRARCSRERLDGLVEEFVARHVSRVGDRFGPIEGARETLLLARELGYRLVVATNPVFPLEAVRLRLGWGGVDDVPFERITSSQSMSRCKPDPGYYRELLEQLGVAGRECLMVGNDPSKDLPAKELGCYTYLLDLPEVRREWAGFERDPRLDGYGSYADLQEWLRRSREARP